MPEDRRKESNGYFSKPRFALRRRLVAAAATFDSEKLDSVTTFSEA
ncbi:hypothetical protein [Nitrososphaera viennensis]|uniref:Uncharacterized protein n=1 Tax=Nitrososphaera viennensis TaxID=1034015 RepID=A0A977IGC3_9ARCH|nr:hypothetical protein [Nitrososphaera viennensis]UVS70420.1 hypothetical protein NWT39_06445 [Nitrososphaera viennensis]